MLSVLVGDNSATTTATSATTTSTDVMTLNYFKTENESKLYNVIRKGIASYVAIDPFPAIAHDCHFVRQDLLRLMG